MKTCKRCQLSLPLSSFRMWGDKYIANCRPCTAIMQRANHAKRAHARGTPGVWRQDDPLNLAMADWIRTS